MPPWGGCPPLLITPGGMPPTLCLFWPSWGGCPPLFHYPGGDAPHFLPVLPHFARPFFSRPSLARTHFARPFFARAVETPPPPDGIKPFHNQPATVIRFFFSSVSQLACIIARVLLTRGGLGLKGPSRRDTAGRNASGRETAGRKTAGRNAGARFCHLA